MFLGQLECRSVFNTFPTVWFIRSQINLLWAFSALPLAALHRIACINCSRAPTMKSLSGSWFSYGRQVLLRKQRSSAFYRFSPGPCIVNIEFQQSRGTLTNRATGHAMIVPVQRQTVIIAEWVRRFIPIIETVQGRRKLNQMAEGLSAPLVTMPPRNLGP